MNCCGRHFKSARQLETHRLFKHQNKVGKMYIDENGETWKRISIGKVWSEKFGEGGWDSGKGLRELEK